MRRFRSDRVPATGERVVLDTQASHHLLRVTGIAPGETVELFDGAGVSAPARLVAVEQGLAVLEGAGEPRAERSGRRLVLLPALLKQQPFDLVVRMAVELGATEIQPVLAARSVARGDRAERWQRIADAAAAQCGRADVPVVRPPTPLVRALADLPDGLLRLVCVPGAEIVQAVDGPAAILLGPEGGFTEDEVAQALAEGFVPVGLGARVLRADTAAAALLARLLR